MPNFSRVISLAYMRLLERPPDPGGLASYNDAMNQGMSEATMREALIRSPGYAQKNPDLAPSRTGSGTPKAVGRRKKPSRRR